MSFRNRLFVLLALMVFAAVIACPVWAEDEGLAKPPRHDFPRVGPYEVIVGDFHMHTIHSDGRLTTRERVEESYRMGYDAIAVTDHGKVKAYRVARYVGEKLGLVVINGFETGVAKQEHMNVFGVSAAHAPRNPHQWSEKTGEKTVFYQDELRKIAKDGGIVIYNHPHKGFREPVKWGIEQGIILGIEVKNDVVGKGWGTVESHGTYCYPFGFDWALENNLAVFANTDAHGRRSDNPTRTLLLVKERTPEAVLDAMRGRRTAAWFDGMLWGREALLRDLITTAVGVTRDVDQVVLENHSPIALRGSIGGKAFEIAAYGKSTVDVAADAKSAAVQWTNVWTSPKTNLTTTLKL